ncbi:Ift81, partial [Symbiodinium sp. KB8]
IKSAVYPVLYYLLSKFKSLKKRAYVARYLLPLEMKVRQAAPAGDCAFQQYRALQLEFRETHKQLETLVRETPAQRQAQGPRHRKTASASPSELRSNITQLEDERRQLVEKIEGLKKRTSEVDGFAPLLAATSALRKEQEEEAKLAERAMEQRQALHLAEGRYAEAARKLAETRANTREELSAEEVFAAARKEFDEGRHLVETLLPNTLKARSATLTRLQRALSEPPKSDSEVAALRAQVSRAEATVADLTSKVAEAQRAAGDDKLAMFRQQAALVARKRADKELALDKAGMEVEEAEREVEGLEARMSAISGPNYMRRDEFKAYAEGLRKKTATYRALREELNALRSEGVVLSKTVSTLKSRATGVDAVLAKLEEQRGITGYMGVQAAKEKVSAEAAVVNDYKGATLQEISRIVGIITAKIAACKDQLQPQVTELKSVREQHADVESGYMAAKRKYDAAAAKFDAQRMDLAKQVAEMEGGVREQERTFHSSSIQLKVLEEQVARATAEAGFRSGSSRLLRDFPSWEAVYKGKLEQQEQMAKSLRAKQKDLKENAGSHAKQRKQFVALRELLRRKISAVEAGESAGAAPADAAFAAVGGANIMTIAE